MKLKNILAAVASLGLLSAGISLPAHAAGGTIDIVNTTDTLAGSTIAGFDPTATLRLAVISSMGTVTWNSNGSGANLVSNAGNKAQGVWLEGTQDQLNAALGEVALNKPCAGSYKIYAQVTDSGLVQDPTTNHLYKLSPNNSNLDPAIADAAATPLVTGGTDTFGYLATVTSTIESIIVSQFFGQGWLPATDRDVEGDWKWITGPEAGTSFYSGNANSGGAVVAGKFAGWGSGEPNDWGNGEDFAEIMGNGLWNDTSEYSHNYTIEWGGMPGDNLSAVTVASDSLDISITGAFTGAGTEASPYLVPDATALYAVAPCGGPDVFFKQTANITLPNTWGGDQAFEGHYDGNGKTIAFSVPLVEKLIAAGSRPRDAGKPRALILAPTRELADQIDRTVKGLARAAGFFTVCIYGGVPQRKQEIAMDRGTDIIVATPGRLEDLMAQGIVDLSMVETMVVDEADHMCDLGFIEPVRRIMRAAGDCQKLLFSATLDREVDSLVKEFLPSPYVYQVPDEEEDNSNITHRVLTVDEQDRSQVLLRLVQGEGKSLIFTRTKMTAERLSESLTAAGVPAARLHGDLNQNQRNRNLERFTSGECRVLVATDVAARGIHVDDVALVIQVDPPQEYKTYLHRAGRTGRAGKEGTVVTLIHRSKRRRLEDLLRRADRDGIFSDVRPSSELIEQLAGPIAPPPAPSGLDFGDSGRGGRGGRGDRDGGDRGGRRDGGRGGRGGFGGGGRDRSGYGRSESAGGRGRGNYGRGRDRD